jgi:N-acetyl-gamma-glutamyl-phosphate reductase
MRALSGSQFGIGLAALREHALVCMVMRMAITVAVAGASGYVGGEVLRVFGAHPDVEFGALTASASAGETLGAHHPHLRSLASRALLDTTPEILAGHDVVVLALPHGHSAEIAASLPPETLVIDCGADHRLASAEDWAEYYGGQHAGTWPYGMPELIVGEGLRQRALLAGARRVAVPGCNVTAVTLGLQPGVAAGLVDPSDIVAVLAVGYSGAGKALKPHLLASEALGSAVPYAVAGAHRHIPEIVQNLKVAGAADVRISFTPVLVPMSRGILATVTAPLAPGATPASVREAWVSAYANEPFVEVLPDGQWPASGATVGSNSVLIGVGVDAKAGKVVIVTALDNLVKGTAGAALQSLNLALGLPEATGLTTNGVAP